MVKHDDLMQQTLIASEGFLFAIDNRHPKFPVAIAHLGSMNPEYQNLLAASGLLYRTAQEAVTFLETLIELLEGHGADELAGPVAAIQGTLDTAMKIAREGFPKRDENSS